MEKKVIFEIPVYSMSEETFDTIIENTFNYRVEFLINNLTEKEKAIKYAKNELSLKRLWKFNQIIGYITISVSKDGLWFNLYKSTVKRQVLGTGVKHYLQDMMMNGTHFHPSITDTNEHILSEIRDYLGTIKDNFLKKENYIDLSIFNIVFPTLNIKQMMVEMGQ